jgi:hypothetical protein
MSEAGTPASEANCQAGSASVPLLPSSPSPDCNIHPTLQSSYGRAGNPTP